MVARTKEGGGCCCQECCVVEELCSAENGVLGIPLQLLGLQKVLFEVWGIFVKALNLKFLLLCYGPSLLTSEHLGTSLFVLIVLFNFMEWSMQVKGGNTFTSLGSEVILWLSTRFEAFSYLVSCFIWSILLKVHWMVDRDFFFCGGDNRNRRANVVVWHLREKDLIIVTQISIGQE